MKSTTPAPHVWILMPMRDKPTRETTAALTSNTGPHTLLTERGKPVDDARNALSVQALALDPLPEIVVLIDDDAWWFPGAVEALVRELKAQPSFAMLVGGFSKRIPHSPTVAYVRAGDASSALILGQNCLPNTVVEIEECGLHACAVRTSALRALGPAPFALRSDKGEDLEFCARLREHGFKIGCIPSVTFAHVDDNVGAVFVPMMGPCEIADNRLRPSQAKGVQTLRFDVGSARSFGTASDALRA
ncbi:MAG TPA: glycosyltransferase family 2 protein [Candidatus Elarobacter sp.]|nr:glycosyltransferase family 2 protein [Candidatus Elarobacter sp.]